MHHVKACLVRTLENTCHLHCTFQGLLPTATAKHAQLTAIHHYLRFEACSVDAAWTVQSSEPAKRSVMIIKFAQSAIDREQRLQR